MNRHLRPRSRLMALWLWLKMAWPLWPLSRWMLARHSRTYWRSPSKETLGPLSFWMKLRGAWMTTAIQNFDEVIAFNPQRISALESEREERLYTFGNSPWVQVKPVPTAHLRPLQDKRLIAVVAGGIGDWILFSQLCRNLTAQQRTRVDVAYFSSGDRALLEKLFAPGEVHAMPLTQALFQRYHAVLPLGLYRIVMGETLTDYFKRAFNVDFAPSGFEQDEAETTRVRLRLKHRHGLDLEGGQLIFIQASCRREKNYPHMEAVAQALMERGRSVVLIGDYGDSALADIPGKLANLCGLSLWSTLCALRHAALVITPDSSFMHAAGALGLPCLALFGPTPTLWAEPYPSITAITYPATCRFLPCWAQLEELPPCGHYINRPCLTQIPPQTLADLALQKCAGNLTSRHYALKEPHSPLLDQIITRDVRPKSLHPLSVPSAVIDQKMED